MVSGKKKGSIPKGWRHVKKLVIEKQTFWRQRIGAKLKYSRNTKTMTELDTFSLLLTEDILEEIVRSTNQRVVERARNEVTDVPYNSSSECETESDNETVAST